MQQAVRNIHVQMGARSLDVPISNAMRLPSLSQLQHHTRTIFKLPPQQAPALLHEGTAVADERRWAGLLGEPRQTQTLMLRLQGEPTPPVIGAEEAPLSPRGPSADVEGVHMDYFAVQGANGHTTLYLDKREFDRRMHEFASEGSLGSGMRAIFPPQYQEEYTTLFREHGAGIVLTSQATALLQQWHKRVAVGGGLVIGGLAAGSLMVGEVASGAAIAGEGAAIAASEASAATLSAEVGLVAAGRTALAYSVGAAAAVTIGYLTYRGLRFLLPQVTKEQYTVMMSVPGEDAGMLAFGRQTSIVESSTGPECGICMERPQDTAAVPCGHTACSICLDQLMRRHSSIHGGQTGCTPCPHCREPITGTQRLFF